VEGDQRNSLAHYCHRLEEGNNYIKLIRPGKVVVINKARREEFIGKKYRQYA